jgi:hypothetical protein
MTKQQTEDFAKLELAYLDQVRERNPDGQIKQMEVIFFWLKKQINAARVNVLIAMPFSETVGIPGPVEITDSQKVEFALLQMGMIRAADRPEPDLALMIEIEMKMRDWIDAQITASVNRLIKPKMKIVRDNGKN